MFSVRGDKGACTCIHGLLHFALGDWVQYFLGGNDEITFGETTRAGVQQVK